MIRTRVYPLILAALLLAHALQAAGASVVLSLPALDMVKVAAEDNLAQFKEHPPRFAIGRDVEYVPGKQGGWIDGSNGRSVWQLRVTTPDAVHLNFGFSRWHLPSSATLVIRSIDKNYELGPFGEQDNRPTGEFWTQILTGREAHLELSVDTREREQVDLKLSRVGQGYRGFGAGSKYCKSGACNTDVACLANDDPWNEPRRAVAAITVNGTDTCTGSLLNNTNGDRRLLFATAAHCSISGSNVASVLAYFNYENPTCRTPGSAASGTPIPKPNTSLAGLGFVAATNSPFSGSTPAGTRSDWTLIELQSSPNQASFNLYWAGWDRRPPPTTCTQPGSPSSTSGLCASIHHPGVDEKRITFVQVPMTLDNISSAQGVHWQANWDPTPPVLANILNPPPTLPPSVTEPGSSGSPLYNAERRLIGVLSGGPSACGATGASLRDQYGGLFHSWEGVGTPTTRMKDHLDPGGGNPETLDGIGQCTPPGVPANIVATTNGSNRVDVGWNAVVGAERYRVFRALGTCPGGAYTQIAEVTGTSYSDLTVSGGSAYSYRISAFDEQETCESARGVCSSAQATGACLLAPTFAGVASVASSGSSTCGINLTWSAAAANCGTTPDLRYNVYRATTAGFTPAPANRVSTCATSNAFADADVTSGTRYYYAVRAEDVAAVTGGGVCGGVEETNVVALSAIPAGPVFVSFEDKVETGPSLWSRAGTGGGANFAIVSTQANSPTQSWFVPDPTISSSRTLTMAAPLVLPTNPSTLEFFHRYATENTYDGGILEYSLNGGTTWTDILAAQGSVPANAARFTAGGYNGTMSESGAFGARAAWHGSFNTTWIRSAVNLSDFVSRTVSFRFRFGSDISIGGSGWWIDDVRVYYGSVCSVIDPDVLHRDGFE